MSLIQGLKATTWFHMRAQLGALKLEMAGIRSSRGSAYAHIKRTYGLRGNKQRVYEQFAQLVKEAEEACR